MYSEINECELARLCSEKDRKAQDLLYTRYAASLLTLCRRYTHDEDEAMDLMIDSLVKALDKICTFNYRGEGSLYSWISKITVNTALKKIRKSRIVAASLSLLSPDKIPEPEQESIPEITQEQLLEIISTLPEVQRTIFNLYCLDGYSHKEIAGMLGISEKGSASLLAKAKARLKKKIKDATLNR